MNGKSKASEHERRDWTIILIILLFGFLCVILAGQWAVRFAPIWKLDTNMQSNLDPNSDFLTNRPVSYYEPLDPSILTQPVWFDVFLTPGASVEARTSIPQTNTPVGTTTPVPIASNPPITPTNTPTIFYATPTNTLIYYPPPPATNTPRPRATNTPITPLPSVDLSITKDDGVAFVNSGGTVIYTVRVTNNGPSNVTGAFLSDPIAGGLSKTAVTCSATTPGQCVTPPTAAQLESGTFTLPTLNNGQFYEITITTDVTTSSGSVTNIAGVGAPSGFTDPTPGNNVAVDTDTVNMVADLSITVTDNSTHYVANAVKSYEIVVSNSGPSDVAGATITNTFSNGNVDPSTIVWTCVPSAGAACTSGPVMGSNLTNEPVNLNSGSSVTFHLDVQVIPSPSGSLVNDVTVTAPAGITDAPGNNSATDTDTLITASTPPPQLGLPPNNDPYTLPAGGTLTLSINLTADGNTSDWDLVYYEYSLASFPPPNTFDGIWLDWIIIEISDGSNWYTVFNWGDNIRDTNTNVDYTILTLPAPPPNPEEMDQRPIAASDLYNSSGVAIDIDSVVPPGTYTFIRLRAPTGDTDGQAEVDGIEILP